MTKNLCVFTLCSHFIQKPFTQSTLFLHVFPIYFNHRQLEIAATQKRLILELIRNYQLSSLLIILLKKRIIHWMVRFFTMCVFTGGCQKNRILPRPRRNRPPTSPTISFMAISWSPSHPHRPPLDSYPSVQLSDPSDASFPRSSPVPSSGISKNTTGAAWSFLVSSPADLSASLAAFQLLLST